MPDELDRIPDASHRCAGAQRGNVVVALLLAFAGGYIDTYTWITHGVLTNAQTVNLVFLGVHATAARWQEAFHFVPSLFAFCVGVVIAAGLRRWKGRAS